MNIYSRIGDCLESAGVIDAVLAYDATEEEVLLQAGFIRCGSVNVGGEIADIYKVSKESKTLYIAMPTISSEEENDFIEKVKQNMETRILYRGHHTNINDKPYLTQWKN